MNPPNRFQQIISRQAQASASLFRNLPPDPERALRIVGKYVELIEVGLEVTAEVSPFRFACKAGCAHCCHSNVEVLPEEAERIARWLIARRTPEQLEALKDLLLAAAPFVASGSKARWDAQVPCALLDPETKTCTAYEVRPIACRAHRAFDANRCRHDNDLPLQLDPLGRATLMAHATGWYGGTTQTNREASIVELTLGLLVCLADRDAFARWMDGEEGAFSDARVPDQGGRVEDGRKVVGTVARMIVSEKGMDRELGEIRALLSELRQEKSRRTQ